MTTVTLGGRRILISKPYDQQYGHLGLEMLMAFAMAKRQGASLHFVRPRGDFGAGLFELDSPDQVLANRTAQLMVTLLLLVICAHIAILVYARTATRQGEIAVRSALGASRARIVAQLFGEALVLSAG